MNLFDWLVEKINKSLEIGDNCHSGRSISILDIYGFESFHVRINYFMSPICTSVILEKN